MAEHVKLLEDAANTLQSPSSLPQQRTQAEHILLSFRRSQNPFPVCMLLLQTSSNPMAVFQVLSTLKEVCVRDFSSLYERGDVKTLVEKLLMYVIHTQNLPLWLVREGFHVIAVLFKRSQIQNSSSSSSSDSSGSGDGGGSGSVNNNNDLSTTILNNLSSLFAGIGEPLETCHRYKRLRGLLLAQSLVEEFSLISRDLSVAQHLSAHRFFETRFLSELLVSTLIFSSWLLLLLEQPKSEFVVSLLDCFFQLICSILSWDFVSDNDEEEETLLTFRLLQLTQNPRQRNNKSSNGQDNQKDEDDGENDNEEDEDEEEAERKENKGLCPGSKNLVWKRLFLDTPFVGDLCNSYTCLLAAVPILGEASILPCLRHVRQCLFSLASLCGSIFEQPSFIANNNANGQNEHARLTWQTKANYFSSIFTTMQKMLLNGLSSSIVKSSDSSSSSSGGGSGSDGRIKDATLSNEGQEEEIIDAARIFHRLVSNKCVDVILLSRMPRNEQFFQEILTLTRLLMCTRSSSFAPRLVKTDPDDMCQAASNMLEIWSILGEQSIRFCQQPSQQQQQQQQQSSSRERKESYLLGESKRSLDERGDDGDDDEEEQEEKQQGKKQFLSFAERQRIDSAISRICELFVTSRIRLASMFAQMDHSDDEQEEDISGPELGAVEVETVAKMGWQMCPVQFSELLLQRGEALLAEMKNFSRHQQTSSFAFAASIHTTPESIQFQCMQEQMRFLLHMFGFLLHFTTSIRSDIFPKLSFFMLSYNELETFFISAQFPQYRWRLLLRTLWCLERWGQLQGAALSESLSSGSCSISSSMPFSPTHTRWYEVLADKAYVILTNNLSWITTGDMVYERALNLLLSVPPSLLIFCINWSKLVVAYFKQSLGHLSGAVRGRLLGLIAQVSLETSTDLGLARSLSNLEEHLQPALLKVEGWLTVGRETNESDGWQLIEGLDILTGLASTTGAEAAGRFTEPLFMYIKSFLTVVCGLSQLMSMERMNSYHLTPSLPRADPAQLKPMQTLLLLKFVRLLRAIGIYKTPHYESDNTIGLSQATLAVWSSVNESVVHWLHQMDIGRGSKLCLEQLVEVIEILLETNTFLAHTRADAHTTVFLNLLAFRPLLSSPILVGSDHIIRAYLSCLELVCYCHYSRDASLVHELVPLLSNFRVRRSVFKVFVRICNLQPPLQQQQRHSQDIVELQEVLWTQLLQGQSHISELLNCLFQAASRNPAAFSMLVSKQTGENISSLLSQGFTQLDLQSLLARLLRNSRQVTIHI